MTKKYFLFIFIFFSFVFLTSCTHRTLLSNETVDSTSLDVQQLDETSFVEIMSFDDYVVSIIYNRNTEIPINRTVDIYGTMLVSNDIDTVKDALENRFSEISLYSGDKCLITANEYSVETNLMNNNEVLFCLHLMVNDVEVENGTYNITEIKFTYPFNNEIIMVSEDYWLTIYKEEQNKINIIESPTTNIIELNQDEFIAVDYFFLSANSNLQNDFSVLFEIPLELKSLIDTSLVSINKDQDMTETALTVLYSDLSAEQRRNLQAYKITVLFTKQTVKGFIVQLLFKIDITDEEYYIGAFCPLIVQ